MATRPRPARCCMNATRESWRLAWPLILSNLSVPLLGVVDTAVVGHLDFAALSRRRGTGRAGDERALLDVRLSADGHDRAHCPGVRRRRRHRSARGRRARHAGGARARPARGPRRTVGRLLERAAVRARDRCGRGVPALSRDPAVRRARRARQHGAAGLAPGPAGFASAAAADDPHQRYQRGPGAPARIRPRPRDEGRRRGDRARRIFRAGARPLAGRGRMAASRRLAGLACPADRRALPPAARGQPRPVPAQPDARGGVPGLRGDRLAPGPGGARGQRRADEFLHCRSLRARRFRPCRRGHGRPRGRRARSARASAPPSGRASPTRPCSHC